MISQLTYQRNTNEKEKFFDKDVILNLLQKG